MVNTKNLFRARFLAKTINVCRERLAHFGFTKKKCQLAISPLFFSVVVVVVLSKNAAIV